MKWFIIILTIISNLISWKLKEPIVVSSSPYHNQAIDKDKYFRGITGRYNLVVHEVTCAKTEQQYVVHIIFDTATGRILKRTTYSFDELFNGVVVKTVSLKKDKDVFDTLGIPLKE